MMSAKLAAILTLLAALAPLPPLVSGIQCWQCAAVDGRKCPDNSNMVDSPQVSYISSAKTNHRVNLQVIGLTFIWMFFPSCLFVKLSSAQAEYGRQGNKQKISQPDPYTNLMK